LMPKGSAIIVPIYAVHHMKEYFPDPEAFKPERFLPQNKDNMNPYTFLSFVVGPRNCIGMRFALLEAKLAMTKIMQNFNVIKSDKTAVPLEFKSINFLLNPKQVVVKFVKTN